MKKLIQELLIFVKRLLYWDEFVYVHCYIRLRYGKVETVKAHWRKWPHTKS